MYTWLTWGWIDVEFRRVIGSKLFLSVLAGLVLLNCFFFIFQRPDTWDDPLLDGELYHETLDSLSNKSWQEALDWCKQYQENAQNAMVENRWDFYGEEEELRSVAIQLQEQYEHLLDYYNYLKKIDYNAKILQSVSLFSDPNSDSYKNIIKTAEDFDDLKGVKISAGHDLAVTEFFVDKWADYSILIVICVVCGLFLAERKEGLWPMIHAASGGRWRLTVTRTGILLAASWIGTVALVGSRILLCGIEYHGLGEWNRALQSIPMFYNVPYPLTVGQFWLMYITVKAFGAFWFGLVLWTLLSSISNLALALGASTVFIAAEFACLAIPSSSMLVTLRYVNIFSYVDYISVFTRYLNLPVFGKLIAGSDLVLMILPVLCLLFLLLVILIDERKHPITATNRFLRFMDWIRKRVSPITDRDNEVTKLLFKRRGILVLLLLILLTYKSEAPPREYDPWDPFVQFYQEIYQGPITEEKIEQMEAHLSFCDTFNAEGLKRVIESAKTAPDGAWIIPTKPYDAILGDNVENYNRTTSLMALLFLVLILSPIASQERQNQMTTLLRSSKNGRDVLMRRKQILLICITALVWLIIYGSELYKTIQAYGSFSCLTAPALSLPVFRWSILPLGWTIGLYYVAKLVILIGVAELCFYLSSRCSKNRDALLLCVGVIVIPAALGAIGSVLGEYLSLLLPLGGVELML
jgi:hypothetical protein